MSWLVTLNKYLDQYGVDAVIQTPDGSKSAPVKLHLAKFSEDILIGDISDAKRRGVVTVRDLETYGEPLSGDKIIYLSKNTTIDFVDPRIEAGAVIGYDLILRGDN